VTGYGTAIKQLGLDDLTAFEVTGYGAAIELLGLDNLTVVEVTGYGAAIEGCGAAVERFNQVKNPKNLDRTGGRWAVAGGWGGRSSLQEQAIFCFS
jgi:hypothetical protein